MESAALDGVLIVWCFLFYFPFPFFSLNLFIFHVHDLDDGYGMEFTNPFCSCMMGTVNWIEESSGLHGCTRGHIINDMGFLRV